MTIEQFIKAYQIKSADAIVVKKENFGILDHYVIFLGHVEGKHLFIANYVSGVKYLSAAEVISFLKTYVPVRINRFIGGELLRIAAVKRAISKLNEKSYHLILNNCEHFANWVQKGLPKSDQVETFGKLLTVVGGIIGFSGVMKKDQTSFLFGLLLASLGMIAISYSLQKDPLPPH